MPYDPCSPMSPQERLRLARRIGQLAHHLSFFPEEKAEGVRHAKNLIAAGRIRQRQANRNQHPTHPPK